MLYSRHIFAGKWAQCTNYKKIYILILIRTTHYNLWFIKVLLLRINTGVAKTLFLRVFDCCDINLSDLL